MERAMAGPVVVLGILLVVVVAAVFVALTVGFVAFLADARF